MSFKFFRNLFSCLRCRKKKRTGPPSNDPSEENSPTALEDSARVTEGIPSPEISAVITDIPERPVERNTPRRSAESMTVPKLPPPPDFIRRRKWPKTPVSPAAEEEEADCPREQAMESESTGIDESEEQLLLYDGCSGWIPIVLYQWHVTRVITILYWCDDIRTRVVELDEDLSFEDLDGVFEDEPQLQFATITTESSVAVPVQVWVRPGQSL